MKTGKYTFHITLEDPAILPFYKGSTFRGSLGHALRQIVCSFKHNSCETCMLNSRCIYSLIFETRLARPAPNGKRISDPPHPLVIEPPLTQQQNFAQGETLCCNLLLFGEINQHLPDFVYAFEQMGRQGIGKMINGHRARFTLTAVTQGDSCLYCKGGDTITVPDTLPEISLSESQDEPVRELRIQLITPMRITGMEKGSPVLPFNNLVRFLIRRNTSLLNIWGMGEPDLDYPSLAKRANNITIAKNHLAWFDWKLYPTRQNRKMFMGGLTGEITYSGDLNRFMSLLHMAQTVHVGKNTSFGLGKIFVEIKS
jgi:hypothetical protein